MLPRSLLAIATALAFMLPVTAVLAQTFTIRVHSFSAPQAPDQVKHLMPWAEKVGKDSGGRLKVEVYPGMQLGGRPADLVQQLEDGVVDMIWTLPGYTPGRFPGLEGMELPFMATGRSESHSQALMEFVDRHLKDSELKGFKIISVHASDAAVLHTTKKPVKTLDDIKGLKIRAAGRYIGEALKALGGTPVGIPLPGVYEALERGQVDGMFTNWAIMPSYRFYEVTKHHTNTPLYQGSFLTLMSQRTYDRLPADLRKVIDDNSGPAYARKLGALWDEQTAPAVDSTRKAGNDIFELTSAERDKWQAAVKPAYDLWIADMTKAGRDGRKMFADMQEITARHGRR